MFFFHIFCLWNHQDVGNNNLFEETVQLQIQISFEEAKLQYLNLYGCFQK